MNRYFFSALIGSLLFPLCGSAAILTGHVYADGKPAAHVAVSDGLEVTTTNSRGFYRIDSDKSSGFVFVVTPSNYVATDVDRLQPLFWAALADDATDEQHDFRLRSVDQSRYTILFLTDVHLTDTPEKHDLQHYRELAVPAIANEVAQASALGPVYTLNLGDLSHELFWYQNNFNLTDARRYVEQCGLSTLMYSIPGNHDNDGGILADADIDRRSEWLYRKEFGPTYYSLNIGKVHWIMMDNILYKNTPGKGKKNVGIVGARDYDKGYTEAQLTWLRNDLAQVSSSQTVCLCTHCPVFFDHYRPTLLTDAGQLQQLDELFARFRQVSIFSGHAHETFTTAPADFPRFVQYILPATSGDMWECHDHFQALCPDGSDAGFLVTTVDGKQLTHRYRTEAYGNKLMRLYDMNSVRDYYLANEWLQLQHTLYPKRADYSDAKYTNCVYVNYWGHRPGEHVEMFEQGEPLRVQQVEDEDPLYDISHYVPHLMQNPNYKASDAKVVCRHMFAAQAHTATAPVTIRVVNASGEVLHEQTLIRPKGFDANIQ
jgi:hypothetical protein